MPSVHWHDAVDDYLTLRLKFLLLVFFAVISKQSGSSKIVAVSRGEVPGISGCTYPLGDGRPRHAPPTFRFLKHARAEARYRRLGQ